jgi:hypothetical protein
LAEDEYETLISHERTGLPLGIESFSTRLKQLTAHFLKKQKPDPKKNN